MACTLFEDSCYVGMPPILWHLAFSDGSVEYDGQKRSQFRRTVFQDASGYVVWARRFLGLVFCKSYLMPSLSTSVSFMSGYGVPEGVGTWLMSSFVKID